jgi:transcription antitermination factor NusG
LTDLSSGVTFPRTFPRLTRLACPTLSIDPSIDRWFIVRTQPHRERWAAENCARQGCEFYLPEILVPTTSTVGGRRHYTSRLQRLFPGYLFVLTPDRQWLFLHSTFGVIAIVMVGSIPGTLAGVEIEKLRRRERGDGYIELPQMPERLPLGAKVRISGENPFIGHNGIVAGMLPGDRVKVLLDLLGRKVTCLFDEDEVEPL